jgi:hypothetical protein
MASGEWPVPAAAVIQSPDATGRNQPEGVIAGRLAALQRLLPITRAFANSR